MLQEVTCIIYTEHQKPVTCWASTGSLFTESNFAFLLDGLVPIRKTNVMCVGNENSLSECSFDGSDGDPTCTHRDDVIITCAGMFIFIVTC